MVSRWIMLPTTLGAIIGITLFLLSPAFAQEIPRTASGKPDLQGIWQAQGNAAYDLQSHAARYDMPPGLGIVDGDEIPYQPWALEQKQLNFTDRANADPFKKCYFPGVPRIMTMQSPFQIHQANEHVVISFEWTQVYRLIYTNGQTPLYPGIESWMGNSRGHWEDDVFVVEINDMNDKTWFDAAGNFHSAALHLTERYRLIDENTLEYEVTIEDENVFTRPWTIRLPLHRQTEMNRLLENQCQAEVEELNGAFARDMQTWFPAEAPVDNQAFNPDASIELPLPTVPDDIPRLANGKPDLTGFFWTDAGGANYGLEAHERDFLIPPSRGAVIDPPDGTLPYQTWARTERLDRIQNHRGYDDPTAHCFVAGIPRSSYIPSPFQMVQTSDYLVILYERMSYRQIPIDGREHLPDEIRLWQGDPVGRWEGDTLVVESTNFNGKTWLNEVGDVVTHAQTVVETFTAISAEQILYRATVSDPIAYTRPWTIEFVFDKQNEELLEVACLEDNNDLQHLKDVQDEYRAALNSAKEMGN